MRILIISTFFPPLNSIASLRPYSWAKYWTLAGHDVTVLTVEQPLGNQVPLEAENPGYQVIAVPMPSFFHHLKQGYRDESNTQEKVTPPIWRRWAVKVFNWLRFSKGVFNACRMPDFTHLWVRPALKAVKECAPWDLVVSTAGPYTVHLVADALKKRGQADRWIADYRDTWSHNYIYPGLFPFNGIERMMERKLLSRADAVTTVSAPFAEEFRKQFGIDNVFTLANGFDPSDSSKVSSDPIFFRDGKVRIVHTGSLYLGKRDPTPLFDAINNLKRSSETAPLLEKLEVLFVGPRQANLQELITQKQVGPWVKLTGFVSRDEALRMQRDAHALLFLPWNDSQVDGVLTGKIFEYLFSKTPIVAVGAPFLDESQRLILEANAGVVCHNIPEIEDFLMKVLQEGRKVFSETKDEVLARYDRRSLAMQMLQLTEVC